MTDFISRLRHLSDSVSGFQDPTEAKRRGQPQAAIQGSEAAAQPQFPSQAQGPRPAKTARVNPLAPPPQAPPPLPYRRRLYSRPLFWLLLLLGTGVAGGVTRSYRVLTAVNESLPDVGSAVTFQRGGTLTLKADDGSILQTLGPATRQTVAIADMPPDLINAFIAAEDRRFYEHNGVDYASIVRASWANFRNRNVVEGASTITQQLARIVFLDQDRTFQRKVREALLARKIDRELGKERTLDRYLNLVYLGAGAYGVGDAAWIYFGKSVEDLTLSEMALIAGMAPAPSFYSPLVNPTAALRQRNLVLSRMENTGAITAQEAADARAEEVATTPNEPRYLYSEFPYFTQFIQQQLAEILTPEELEQGGLTVETSLNVQWQRMAENTVENAIEGMGRRQRFGQAALVAVDPRNGEIKAMVGGDDFDESQFNRAVQAQRQPGSTFKTFVYAAAIAAGMSPYKPYTDARFVVDGYEPKNFGGGYRGDVNMREALVSSINIVAVKTLIDVGFDPVVNLAQSMGIESELVPTYSMALGASEVNLLELTSAYGTLANRGQHVKPHGITRITNSAGEVLYQVEREATQAIDAESADIMTWMLQGVVQGGTGSNANIGRPVAGKTGTSERNRDLWFIGYTPQLSVGVWLGNDDSSPTWGASSSAATIWRQFVSQFIDYLPVESFPELPQLAGREGSIEADPVRPSRVVSSPVESNRAPRATPRTEPATGSDRSESASSEDSSSGRSASEESGSGSAGSSRAGSGSSGSGGSGSSGASSSGSGSGSGSSGSSSGSSGGSAGGSGGGSEPSPAPAPAPTPAPPAPAPAPPPAPAPAPPPAPAPAPVDAAPVAPPTPAPAPAPAPSESNGGE